jgi:hypothetical protein
MASSRHQIMHPPNTGMLIFFWRVSVLHLLCAALLADLCTVLPRLHIRRYMEVYTKLHYINTSSAAGMKAYLGVQTSRCAV